MDHDQKKANLLHNHDPVRLLENYGSPLFVYDELVLKERCRMMKNLCHLPDFRVFYSAKANSSIALLKIIKSEGLMVDTLSLGEIYLAQCAGYRAEEMFFLSNNVRKKDFAAVAQQGVPICVDSLQELEYLLQFNHRIKNLSIRVNTGISDGHNEKVKTQGPVKFGISVEDLPQAFSMAEKAEKPIQGIFSHVGSFFLDPASYHNNVETMLKLAEEYPNVDHVDFGGGFGVPYDRKNQKPFPIKEYGKLFHETLLSWLFKTKRRVNFSIQPGRFVVAEAGFLICTVQTVKKNFGKTFVGTDLGFNFFPRPMMYNSYHEIFSTREIRSPLSVDIVGNLCESGDILAKNQIVDKNTAPGDVLFIRDAGAYCFSMSSNYNSMLRPAEILLQENGSVRLIRKTEPIDSLSRFQIYD